MTRYQQVLGAILTGVWVVLYLAAAFYDTALIGLAMSATPVLLIPVGFIFGKTTLDIIRGKGESKIE